MVNNNNLIKLLIENNQYCKYPPVFMFLKLNKLMPVLISTFLFSGLIYMFYNAVKTIFEKNQSSKVLDY